MRTHGTLIAAGLLGSAYAAARSPVYVSGPSIRSAQIGNDAPSISLSNARLYFAQRLGLSDAYSINGADQDTIDLLNQIREPQQQLFTSDRDEDKPRRTLVIVEGVDNPEDFFGADIRPHFHVDRTPSMSDNLHLVSTLLQQDRDKRKSSEACGSFITTSDIKDSIQGGYSTSDPLGTCELDSIQSDSWWKSLSLANKFDVLHASASDIASEMYQKNIPAWKLSDVTGIFHVWTLHELAAKHGTSGAEYTKARTALKASLGRLLDSAGEATVVLSPYSRGPTPKRSAPNARVERRADRVLDVAAVESSVLGVPTKTSTATATAIPHTTIARCYSAESACIAATANCTGHGSCTLQWTEMDSEDEKGAECWACSCRPSILVQGDSQGRNAKTVYWGGPACQKKDISAQFWLFAGFGIAMAAAVSYGIGMLYNMGEEDLPSVLGAGVATAGSRAK